MNGNFNHSKSKAVAVTSFPNGRVTTMLQNSFPNRVGPNTRIKAYSRAQLLGQNIKNFRMQDANRQIIK